MNLPPALRITRHSVVILLFCVVLITVTVAHFMGWEMGDKTWILMVANMIHHGKTLYVDMLDVNPPLIFWCYLLAVTVAEFLSLHDYSVLNGMTLILVASSVYLSVSIIRHHPILGATTRSLQLFAFMLLLLFIVWTNPAYFGDREHIFIVLIFPYLLRYSPTLAQVNFSSSIRYVIALLAGIGFCIKPYCLIFFAVVVLAAVVRARSLRPILAVENIIIGCVGLLYMSAILIITPQYVELMVPIAMLFYGNVRGNVPFFIYYLGPLITLAVACADFSFKAKTPLRSDIVYFLILIGAGVAYVQVNNGWEYTFYPLSTMVATCVFYLWREYVWLAKDAISKGTDSKRYYFGANACKIALGTNVAYTFVMAVIFLTYTTDPIYDRRECANKLAAIMKENKAKSFGALSSFVIIWPILARQTGAQMETSGSTWIINQIYKNAWEERYKHAWVSNYVADNVASSLRNNKPDIIFEEFWPPPNQGDILSYLNQYQTFVSAFSAYMPIKTEGIPSIGCPYQAHKIVR